MERRFESELKTLKSRILEMGGYVEQAIDVATEALHARSTAKLDDVHPLERKINEAHVLIDNQCVELLARQSPFAADLRLVIAIIKINTDLERMGDQAVNIAYNTERYLHDHRIDLGQDDLAKMAVAVKAMVRNALDAFMKQDVNLAQVVLEADDEVDAYKRKMFDQLLPFMKQEPSHVESALDLILIARNLERMGDHATNIAEDVIFACTGEDVRHGGGGPAT
jgi:phosphate transport system protein